MTQNLIQVKGVPNEGLRKRLIEREKRLIAESSRMLGVVRGMNAWQARDYRLVKSEATKRLSMLRVGLMPVRISGPFYRMRQLINAGLSLPQAIVEKALEIEQRFPGADLKVAGWTPGENRAVSRTRDPVLIATYGEANFFVAFWLELDTGDDGLEEFFGITVPILPKPGRGRPKKNE